ncbi:MAG: hypothetical protein MK111_22840 [Crocosphaera sp.]|uniref:Uncharacterized protein n=3 Tax=Crocosphaera watsonii TaxID=263511 RepID=T2K065_CROWT|nr:MULTISPECIES: hypothetical protein [Crocosphaera]MCH2231593.1 hypothetical protein [Crocinitomicaceae bacterium]EHJ09388.1 Dihydroorotase [Crocosphaera watsonii WH 0003]MCH2247434.1 hypothetical protein [Crocosphaera sp.]CCQ55286.1 hypothetical protein CWATWH0005_5466 [Crocosphaera watsonii WH 0005]CCQ70985.1 hypothetical protein CWATWH0402_1894 [Crocosphaera watsonii WH 0402]
MSGTPKCSQAQLDAQRREALRREMERIAAEEQRKREEAARKERERIAKATKQANQDLTELKALIAGTKADNLLSYWCKTEIQSLESQITEAENSLKQQEFSQIKTLLQQAKNQQKEMLTKAQEKQQHKEEQTIYVETLQEVLDDMGFYTQKVPTATSSAPDAQITFVTENSLGEEIEVTVGLEGKVEYVAEGFGDKQEDSFDGKQIKSCPKTIPTLLKVHEKAEEKGVILTPPTWLDQDPNRNLSEAESLPKNDSKPKERTRNSI